MVSNNMVEKLFKKVSKLEKKKLDIQKRKQEIESLVGSCDILREYIEVLNQLQENSGLITTSLEELRVSMDSEDMTKLEDNRIIVTRTKGYTKTVIDSSLFYENFKPTSKTYQKVVVEKPVKSSIKLKEKLI